MWVARVHGKLLTERCADCKCKAVKNGLSQINVAINIPTMGSLN